MVPQNCQYQPNLVPVSTYCPPKSVRCLLFVNGQLHLNTNYDVTLWIFCVITNILNHVSDNSDINNRKQVNKVIKTFFMAYLMMDLILTQTCLGVSIMTLTKIMVPFMRSNLYRKSNTSVVVVVIFGIRGIHYYAQSFLFFSMQIHLKGSWYWCC